MNCTLSTDKLGLAPSLARKSVVFFILPFIARKRVGQVAYKLDIAPEMAIHPIFHVSLLRPYRDPDVTIGAAPVEKSISFDGKGKEPSMAPMFRRGTSTPRGCRPST